MTTINLKDFYYWYIQDQFIEVADEVAEALTASRRQEAAYVERARETASEPASAPQNDTSEEHHD